MSWKYKYPSMDDYDTIEEYEDAVEAYEMAEDRYADEFIERNRLM